MQAGSAVGGVLGSLRSCSGTRGHSGARSSVGRRGVSLQRRRSFEGSASLAQSRHPPHPPTRIPLRSPRSEIPCTLLGAYRRAGADRERCCAAPEGDLPTESEVSSP